MPKSYRIPSLQEMLNNVHRVSINLGGQRMIKERVMKEPQPSCTNKGIQTNMA